jgi:hypothetical protein
MGRFAEKTIIDYHLSFAYQRKIILLFYVSVYSQTDGSLPFLFFICNKQTEVAIFR